jgi:integrase
MPTVNLTARLTDSIKSSGRRLEYFDDSLPGFCLRVTETGHKSWGVYYRFADRLHRLSLGNYPVLSLKEARSKAKNALHDAANGTNPAAQKRQERNAESFEYLAQEYLERHAKAKKKSWAEDDRIIKSNLIPAFGEMRAKDVARRDVRALLERIAMKAPIMANRVRALLRKMFNWGILNEIVETNPAYLVPMPGKERRRERVLSEDEIAAVWKAIDKDSADADKAHRKIKALSAGILKLRLLTLQRGSEIMGMEWAEVDLKTGWWTIPGTRTKNGLEHRVPLTLPALTILEQMRTVVQNQANRKSRPDRTTPTSQYVFPSPRGDRHIRDEKKVILRIRTATGIHFWGRDLRRTGASMMTSSGIPRLTVRKILNHVEPEITAVYDRYSYDPEKREALEAWSKRLMLPASKSME